MAQRFFRPKRSNFRKERVRHKEKPTTEEKGTIKNKNTFLCREGSGGEVRKSGDCSAIFSFEEDKNPGCRRMANQ